MDRAKSSTFKGFRTFLVVGFTVLPILIIVTLINHYSITLHVEESSKPDVLSGRGLNVSTDVLKEDEDVSFVVNSQNMGGKDMNVTGLEVVKENVLEEKAHDGLLTSAETIPIRTTFDAGQKNKLIANVSNGSSLSNTVINDKLLNELLSAAFDEGSCLSRYKSYLYRKASPHKPSAYLISKLRNYEQLHGRCGPLAKSFDKFMKKGKKSRKNVGASKCKYLVWTAANGLGNRMITLASAFLYAILTDRVLLVRFGSDMVGLFCEPFPNSSWLLPQNFSYRKEQNHIETYESLLNKTRDSNHVFWPSILILNLQHTHDGHNNFFHCDHSQSLLQKVPVLILRSDQYFSPSLFMIPSFRQELSKMFPEKDTVFHHLGRYLFHPSNEVWEVISSFYEAHLAKANERIGLQVRLYNTHRVPHETVIGEILACAYKHDLLPQLDHHKPETSPSKNTSKAFLVASLYSEYGEKLRDMYLRNTTVTREVVRVYQPSHEGHQKSNDNSHNIKAWTEMYLLSLCDALITSPKSTFGYVAHALGGLKPWILQRAYDKRIPDPPCVHAVSMEPCLHYPPKHDCKANKIVHFTSLFPHIMNCEDVNKGLKLVDVHHSATNS